MIHLNRPLNLEERALALQVRSSRAPNGLYVRCYNRGERRPAWSVAGWGNFLGSEYRTLKICRGGYSHLGWDADAVSGGQATSVDRIELIIGVNKPSDQVYDLYVKDGWTVARPELVTDLQHVVPLRRRFDFSGSVTILHGDSVAGRQGAVQLQKVLPRSVTRVGTLADRVPRGQTILLGNMGDNPAMLTAYARCWAPYDHRFPGEGKYVATVLPDCFRRGEDVLVVGASDDRGLALGCSALAAKLREGPVVEHFFLSNLSVPACKKTHVADGLATSRSRLARGAHTSLGGQLDTIARHYVQYRRPEDASLFVAVAKLYGESAKSDPRKFGGPWGFDSDFRSYGAIFGWDVIEHDPVLTDEDRLLVSRVLGRWLVEAIAREAQGGLSGESVVSNHLTFASLGTMAGAEYFGKNYAGILEEPELWRRIVKHNFARQSDAFKALDDCNGYQWLTWGHLARYAMAQPEGTFFANGVAQKVLRGLLLTMDNLGIQVPYGDTGSWRCWTSEVVFLKKCYAETRWPLAAFALEQKRKDKAIDSGDYTLRLPPAGKEPEGFRGVQVFPLDPKYYSNGKGKADPPLEQCFDKISMRESFDPDDFYLLLDGVNNGGHRHQDVNSVLRHTQYGRIWLADNDYFKGQQKFHNSLLMTVNGEAVPLGNYAVLLDRGDNETFGWSSTQMRHERLPWTRHVVWLKEEKAYAVLDSVVPQENMKVTLKQRWNGLGAVTRKADGVEFAQTGAVLRYQGMERKNWSLYDDAALGKNWAGYRYAPQIVRVMDQVRSCDARKNVPLQVGGVWHGDRTSVRPWQVTAIPGGMAIETGRRRYEMVEDRSGRLKLTVSAQAREISEPVAEADGSASVAVPSLRRVSYRCHETLADEVALLTSLENRSRIPVRFGGVRPRGKNRLIPGAPNDLAALFDGSWSGGEDSVMLEKNQIGEWTFDFAQAQAISLVRVHCWWGESSRGTVHKLQEIRVYVDGAEAGRLDLSQDVHPSFGTPVQFDVAFKPVRGRQVRVVILPRKDVHLYICEILAGGPPPRDIPAMANLETFTALTEFNGRLLAGTASGKLIGEDGSVTMLKKRAIHALTVADITGDGRPELLVGASDYLMVFKADGKTLLWERKIPYYRNPGTVRVVRAGDLDGDGKLEVLCGADNWRTYAFTREGKELWNYEVVHPTRAVELCDLDGDGKLEVLCGTIYYSASILNHDGRRRWRAGFGPGCAAFRCLRGGDGAYRVIAASNDGNVYFFTAAGQRIHHFNTGDEVRVLASSVRHGMVFAGSCNGLLYRFGAEGKLLGFTELGEEVIALSETRPDGSVFAGTRNGRVCLVRGDGAIVSQVRLKGGITGLLLRGDDRVAVITDAGEIGEYSLP